MTRANRTTRIAKREKPFYSQTAADQVVQALESVGEGPGIDIVTGGIIGVGLDSILLVHANGDPASEYAFTEAGFNSALSAAASGDVIMLPAGTLATDHTIPAGVQVVGLGYNSVLGGTITNNGILQNVLCTGTVNHGEGSYNAYFMTEIVGENPTDQTFLFAANGTSPGASIQVQGEGNADYEGGAYFDALGYWESALNLRTDNNTADQKFIRLVNIDDQIKFQLLSDDGTSVIRDIWTVGVGGGGSHETWWDAKLEGGLLGDGSTDDTTALQALINTATDSGTRSATIYFPPGIYIIGGALQDTSARNGQIVLPTVANTAPQITIKFLGAARAPLAVHGSMPNPGGYSILRSTLTGASGTAAVISGGNGTWPTQNNVSVVVENLICMAPANPSLSWWNLTTCQGGAIKGTYVVVSEWSTVPYTQPTNSNAYGIKLPQWGQSNVTLVDGVIVGGFYTGLLQGELAYVRGYASGQCYVGMELPESEHASLVMGAQFTACAYGIKVTGSHYCDIWYDGEHYENPPWPAWEVTLYDLYDPDDYLHGHVRWFNLSASTQLPDHTFTVSGGANAFYEEIGELGPVSGVTAGSYTTADITVDKYGRVTAAASGTIPATSGEVLMADGEASATPLANEEDDDWLYEN